MSGDRTCSRAGCGLDSEKVLDGELPQDLESDGLTLVLSSSTTAAPAPHSTTPSSGGITSANPSHLSTIGAFNGSGIALASESFGSGGYGSIVMYFQHHTGQIRQAQLGSDGNWKGGDVTQIVAADAKNGTPIAAVAYARNDTAAVSIQKSPERCCILIPS